MKKVMVILLLAVVTSGSAFAQKGMQGVGVNAAMNAHVGSGASTSLGPSVKYQYNISNFIRIEPSFSYYFPFNNSKEGFEMAGLLNGHLFFLPPQVFRPYFFAGVGYVSYRSIEKKLISESYSGYTNYHTEKEEQTKGKFGVDAGFGIDYRISHKISIQVEAGYMVGFGDESPFKDCSAIKANLGICYNF